LPDFFTNSNPFHRVFCSTLKGSSIRLMRTSTVIHAQRRRRLDSLFLPILILLKLLA
jgi:hypothetical protein